jgi:hypothetical protein
MRVFLIAILIPLNCLALFARPRISTEVPAKPIEDQAYFKKIKREIGSLVSKSDVIITGRIIKFYRSRQCTDGLEVGGVAFDVAVEQVLLGKNLPRQIHVKSRNHDSYGVYKKNDKVLLFLYYSKNKLFQVPPACYIQKGIERDDGKSTFIPHGGIYIYPLGEFSALIERAINGKSASQAKPWKPRLKGWYFILLAGMAILSVGGMVCRTRESKE